MDEDISIINANTRKEKIKNFFINNKKKITIFVSVIILIIFGYFIYKDFEKKNKIELANRYNFATINFISGDKTKIGKSLTNESQKEQMSANLDQCTENEYIEFKNALNSINPERKLNSLFSNRLKI